MANSNGGAAPADNAPDLGPDALLYIEKVRQTTKRLSAAQPAPDDIEGVVQAVRDVASFDVEVPVASRRREFELLKTGVKRLSVWYMRYLAEQLNVFGARVVNLGDALAKRTDALAAVSDDLAVRVGAVEQRLKRLEAASVAPSAAAKPVAAKPAAAKSVAAKPAPARDGAPASMEASTTAATRGPARPARAAKKPPTARTGK